MWAYDIAMQLMEAGWDGLTALRIARMYATMGRI